jgi:Xaa-Pro aminopeptidase
VKRDYLPQLSRTERDRRWSALRTAMEKQGLDCLFIWANNRSWGIGLQNFRYVTHVGAREGIALFSLKRDPIVFAGNPHYYVPYNIFAEHQNWTSDVRPLSGGIRPVVDAVKELGLENGHFGVVDTRGELTYHTIPYEPFKQMLEALPGAKFQNATMLVEEIRMIKSAEEITLMQKSGDIAQAMVQKMVETCRPGVPEAEVYAEMHKTLLVNGGEDYVFNIFDSGNLDDVDLHLQHGKENPLSPTMRMLRPRDIIMTEFHSNYGGYLTGCEKSVYLGKPPQQLKDLHELCLEAFDKGTAAMKPGNLFTDAVEAFRKPVLKAKKDFIELGLHGHGIGSPEFPTRVYKASSSHTLAGSAVDKIVLQENMVFGTNIDIHDPDWRSDVGLMFGDTVVVTAKGPRSLINTPRDLEKV